MKTKFKKGISKIRYSSKKRKFSRTRRTKRKSKRHTNKVGRNIIQNGGTSYHNITYVISSHGLLLQQQFIVPNNTLLHFYTREGQPLVCTIHTPNSICNNPRVHEFEYAIHYGSDRVINDYLLIGGDTYFMSGVKRCEGNNVIFSIDRNAYNKQILFSNLLQIIKNDFDTNYGGYGIMHIHCLFCRN
jgi:hypothetical protein